MSYKIICDSSSNLYRIDNINYAYAPMKIITSDREFEDNEFTNIEEMVEYLATYKGKSGTSCPNINDWYQHFEGENEIYTVTITSNLSGCHNACIQAKNAYLADHPEAKICVIDSLSTGPEMELIVEKIIELKAAGKSFEEVCSEIEAYQKTTHLVFMLKSVNNLANNGRVNPALAKVIGFLSIRIVGKASDEGTLEPLHKLKGAKKCLNTLMEVMEQHNYKGGKVIISHCDNEKEASMLANLLKEKYGVEVKLRNNGALCSFYAEKGGFLIGYEG